MKHDSINIYFKSRFLTLFFILGLMAIPTAMASDTAPKVLNVFIQSDHTGHPKFLFRSPDNTILGSVGGDSDVKLWDIRSGLQIKTFRIKQDFFVFSAAISPANKWLATGGQDGVLRVWDMQTGTLSFSIKDTEKSVNTVMFTQNGQYVLYGSDDQMLRLVSIGKRSIVQSRPFDSAPFSLCEIPDNGHIMAGCFHGELYEYTSPEEGFAYQSMVMPHIQPIEALAVSPDGERLITASQDNQAKLWKREKNGRKSWALMKTYKAKDGADSLNLSLKGFFTAGFSPDGKRFAIAGQDERLRICDSQTGDLYKRYMIDASVDSLVFTGPDALTVIQSGSNKLFNYAISRGKRFELFTGQTVPVETVAVAGDYAISVDAHDHASVWSLPKGDLIKTFDAKNGCSQPFGRTVSISPDGGFYAITDGQNINLCDGVTHKTVKTVSYKSYSICSLTLAPNGKHLAFISGPAMILWDLQANKEVLREMTVTYTNQCLAISPDSALLVYGASEATLAIYDIRHQKQIVVKALPAPAISLAFSPDGRFFAVGCEDKTIRIMESRTGKVSRNLSGHSGYSLAAIAWSPDGKTLASSNQSGEFLVWDTRAWTLSKSIKTHFGTVNTLAFTRNGRYVVSGGDDGSVRFHDLKTFDNALSFFILPNNEWAAITGKGYYNASNGGGKFINANSGLHVSRIDSYAPAYFRPDLIPVILSGEGSGDFQPATTEKTPPVSRFKDIPEQTSKDTVTLSVETTDTGGGIGQTVFYLNGSAIRTDNGRGLKAVHKNKALVRTYDITLNPGLNEIRVVTFNQANTVEGNPDLAHITYTTPQPAGTGMYGMVIGIDTYRNPGLNLQFAGKDAHLFAETLSKKGKKLFSTVKLDVMTSPEDTSKKAILRALNTYQNLSPNDLFVFYVAAHGVVDDGEFFLLTSNVGHLSSEKLRHDALSQTTLKEIVSNIPTSKKLIVLDTCNSQALGNALETAFLTRGLSQSTAVKLLARSTGSTILSASKTGQEAIEGYKGHGLFTHTIVQALNGEADMNSDGFVKTTELADFVEETVTELSESIFKKPQFPVVSRSGQSFPVSSH